jgi:AcrR family transcriptional regulator
MKGMSVRDQLEPGVAGEACEHAGPAACAQAERRLRADAARNRAAIVAVARDVFAEHGLEAPLELIAARAGVGIATLYRRFPTREKLVAAALVEKVAEYAEAARQALAVPDPWDGFAGFVERICELQAGDRGLSDLLSMTLSADEQVEAAPPDGQRPAHHRDRPGQGRTAALREDFVGEDLVLLLIATAAVMHVTHADAPERLAAVRSPGPRCLRAPATRRGYAKTTLPEPPSTAQMTQAMIRLAAGARLRQTIGNPALAD